MNGLLIKKIKTATNFSGSTLEAQLAALTGTAPAPKTAEEGQSKGTEDTTSTDSSGASTDASDSPPPSAPPAGSPDDWDDDVPF